MLAARGGGESEEEGEGEGYRVCRKNPILNIVERRQARGVLLPVPRFWEPLAMTSLGRCYPLAARSRPTATDAARN